MPNIYGFTLKWGEEEVIITSVNPLSFLLHEFKEYDRGKHKNYNYETITQGLTSFFSVSKISFIFSKAPTEFTNELFEATFTHQISKYVSKITLETTLQYTSANPNVA